VIHSKPLSSLSKIQSMKHLKTHTCSLTIATLTAVSALHCIAAEPIIVESRKADGNLNTPAWSEISGKWKPSKNKTRVAAASSLVATNVSICATNIPVPAFRISPAGLEMGIAYKVDVTFSTSKTQAAAPDLLVAISADGVSSSTLATNTAAFQGAGADQWNSLGTITPSTNRPTLTFSYVSGTLSPVSRWYADAIRFTPTSK
jgi:hypothetical protein